VLPRPSFRRPGRSVGSSQDRIRRGPRRKSSGMKPTRSTWPPKRWSRSNGQRPNQGRESHGRVRLYHSEPSAHSQRHVRPSVTGPGTFRPGTVPSLTPGRVTEPLIRSAPRTRSGQHAGFLERQARRAVKHARRVTVPQVHQEVGPPAIIPKERGVDLCIVESPTSRRCRVPWRGRQSSGTPLATSIAKRRGRRQSIIAGKTRRSRPDCAEKALAAFEELRIIGHDHGNRCGHGLFRVAR